MNTTIERSAYIATLTNRYTTELAYLTSQGLTPEIFWTGSESAITAKVDDTNYLLAVNADACLVGPYEEALGISTGDWYIGIHAADAEEGDYQIAEGVDSEFVDAYAAARASLERGDFDE